MASAPQEPVVPYYRFGLGPSIRSPSGPQSQPYGIAFTKGAVYYNELNAKPNTMVRFDPATEKFQTWAIPDGGDIVRNVDVTRDGNIVTANSLVNQIGLLELR